MIAVNVRVPEVNLVSPEDREQTAAFEILGIHLPVASAENVKRIKVRVR